MLLTIDFIPLSDLVLLAPWKSWMIAVSFTNSMLLKSIGLNLSRLIFKYGTK